jgi:hypothetical protein
MKVVMRKRVKKKYIIGQLVPYIKQIDKFINIVAYLWPIGNSSPVYKLSYLDFEFNFVVFPLVHLLSKYLLKTAQQ